MSRRPYPPTPEEVNNDDEHILANIRVTATSESDPPDINIIMEDDLASPPDDEDILREIAEQQRLCPDLAPIIQYLEQGDLNSNDTKARCLVIESSEYAIDNGAFTITTNHVPKALPGAISINSPPEYYNALT